MKHHHLAAACLICLLALSAAPAFAENPLPTFDKEAVRTYPFMRTGSPEIEVERQEVKPSEEYRKATRARTKIRPFSSNP